MYLPEIAKIEYYCQTVVPAEDFVAAGGGYSYWNCGIMRKTLPLLPEMTAELASPRLGEPGLLLWCLYCFQW